MRRCRPWCGRRCCRRSSGMGKCAAGASTTSALPSRARIRWVWHGSIAASWASRTTAKWRPASRWPMTTPACRSPTGRSCWRPGPTIRPAGPRPGCRQRSALRARSRSPSGNCAKRWPTACWWGSCRRAPTYCSRPSHHGDNAIRATAAARASGDKRPSTASRSQCPGPSHAFTLALSTSRFVADRGKSSTKAM
jgi:hypothetical protein